MNNSKIIIILSILLLVNLIIVQGSIYIKDISPRDTIYKKYSTLSCYFRFTFLCSSDGSDVCGSQLVISPNTPSVLELTNGTSSIYSIGFSTSTGKFSYDIYSGAHTLNIECNELDLDLISFKLKNKVSQYSFLDFNSYLIGVYELQGLNISSTSSVSLVPESISFPNCALLYLCSNDFILQCYSNKLIPDINLLSSVNITIRSALKYKSFLFEPLVSKEYYNAITDITYYPALEKLSNITLFGYNEAPLVSITINNTYSNIYFAFINSINSYIYIPTNGNESSTTFILPINSISNSSYQLYIQNGDTLKPYLNISNVNINQYNDFEKLQIPNNAHFEASTTSYYSTIASTINIEFKNDKLNSLTPIIIDFGMGISAFIKSMLYPYGFTNGTGSNYSYEISNPVLPYSYIRTIQGNTPVSLISALDGSLYTFKYTNLDNSIIYDTSLSPQILDIQFIHLVSDLFMIRVQAKIPYKFLYIKLTTSSKYIGPEALVYGTLYEGTFEFISPSLFGSSFSLYDSYQNYIQINDGQYVSMNPLSIFQNPMTIDFDITLIQNVSFLYNDLDVSFHRHYNILYFNYSEQVPRDYPIIMQANGIENVQNKISNRLLDNIFYSTYNDTLQLFQIQFYVDANIPIGDYPFSLIFSSQKSIYSGSLNTQLRIKKSVLDLNGPIFKTIIKLNQDIYINDSIGYHDEFGWRITIEDSVNGFDSGYLIIRGEMDLSIYNITFNSNDVLKGGDEFLGDYEFKLNISYPCVSQHYIITQVVLYDRMNRVSYFSILPPDSIYISALNPFLNYLNDPNINKIQIQCQVDSNASLDTTPPELTYFDVTYVSSDTSGPRIQLQVIFQAIDLESGLKQDQYPVIYLNTFNNDILECKSFIMSSYESGATYSCSIYIPIGYGSGNPITLSVYGFLNNNGLHSGFTTDQLNGMGYRGILPTSFVSMQNNLISSFTFNSRGGDLWLFGRCFGSDSMVSIYNDVNSTILTPSVIYSTAIKVSNVNATDQPFFVSVLQGGSSTSSIQVTPTKFDFYLSQKPLPPTLPPIVPTNAPQKCLGSPICGGPTNGKCIENQGCLCYSPWIGIDCLSQIIVVNPPIINTGNGSDDNTGSPSIEIIVPDTNNNNNNNTNNNTKPITYSSLISIVALREIDINGVVVKSYTFKENWVSKQLDSSTYAFYTLIQDINNNQSIDVTAILKWFTNQTTISFADQELIMNPYSIKYTIEIGSYPFSSLLNQLQLVMSALIQSNTTDNICSVREFGETTSGDNSNYIKIQVDNHSLFGRFIRRGIVDSNFRTITNLLLDKDMNPITTSKSLQSFIAIQIPNYKDSIVIDPDFSVILDSYSASSKSNSICSNNSKLSSGKIAGIVIGGVAFIVILIVAVSYHIIKNKNSKRFLKSIDQKMKQINNDKL